MAIPSKKEAFIVTQSIYTILMEKSIIFPHQLEKWFSIIVLREREKKNPFSQLPKKKLFSTLKMHPNSSYWSVADLFILLLCFTIFKQTNKNIFTFYWRQKMVVFLVAASSSG